MTRPSIDQQVIFLYVHDLERTARFYEAVMGLSLALDQGKCRIYHVTGTAFIGFCQRDNAEPMRAQIILTIVTEDVDSWYDYLRGQGVAFEKTPAYNPDYNIYHCFVRDPNGYLIEIQRFLDPQWGQVTGGAT